MGVGKKQKTPLTQEKKTENRLDLIRTKLLSFLPFEFSDIGKRDRIGMQSVAGPSSFRPPFSFTWADRLLEASRHNGVGRGLPSWRPHSCSRVLGCLESLVWIGHMLAPCVSQQCDCCARAGP